MLSIYQSTLTSATWSTIILLYCPTVTSHSYETFNVINFYSRLTCPHWCTSSTLHPTSPSSLFPSSSLSWRWYLVLTTPPSPHPPSSLPSPSPSFTLQHFSSSLGIYSILRPWPTQHWNLVEICTLQTSLRDSQSMQKCIALKQTAGETMAKMAT